MSERARKALSELQTSVLFAADFPRRVTYTRHQLKELLDTRSTEIHRPGFEAIERARSECNRLSDLVRTLEREKYEPAVPTLARLWRECALQPVWGPVGHALFAIATPEAMEALLSMIEDHENLAQHMAFKAVFVRGSTDAFDFFEKHFAISDGKHWLLPAVLYFLRDGGIGVQPEHMLQDARWIDLCARYRNHATLGHPAKEVLLIAPVATRDAALRKAKSLETPPTLRSARDGSLLNRYQRGDFEQVWRDIRTHARIDGEFRDEVLEVAEATMQRVAHNADLIAERLRSVGWQALLADYHDLRTPPKAANEAVFARIAEISGAPVPPTLLAFWRVVGGINWVWDYKASVEQPDLGFALPPEEHDALCVDAPQVITYLFDEWIDQTQGIAPDLAHPLRIDLAPDFYHKANYSGGSPYSIAVPFLGADPLFADERHELPFLDYLRLAFQWSGFPGLDRHADRQDVQEFVARFGKGLIPF